MILVDTGPLVALCDRRDSHHRRAVKHLGKLAAQPLASCEAVVTEACFHLPGMPARRRLRALMTDLELAILPVAVTSVDREAVFAWLDRYAEHEPDWADACLAVLTGRDRSRSIWTYDREFQTTWRRPDGSRIPLAV